MSKNIIALILMTLLSVQAAIAAIDAMELALQQPYQHSQRLRWENIVASPLSLNQQQAFNFPLWNTPSIRLQADQQSRFYVPPYESLRLYHSQRQLQASDVVAYLSNGTGLLKQATIQTTTDGHSLIISPQTAHTMIVHLNRSAELDENLELEVFISRREQLNMTAPYRNLKWLSGKKAWLSKERFQMPVLFWQMNAHQKQVIEVDGPARIKLRNRLRFETQSTQLKQDYRIKYWLDDGAPVWLDITTNAESRNIFVNTQMEALGREQQDYIEIPEGHHRLHLMSDSNLYLQVLEQKENDYLLPALNQPPVSVQAVREQGLMAKQPLPAINAVAQRMARDNRRQSSALSAQQLLQQAALQRMDYPVALVEARKLLAQHTIFRNLQPSVKYSKDHQFNAYFVNKHLKAINKPQQDSILSVRHRPTALKGLGNSYFSPVASGPNKDSYSLPERYSPTSLRIIVDRRQCSERRFKIQMDQLPAQVFIMRCQDDVSTADGFLKSLSETALLALQKQLGTTENTTLSHLFSAYRKPAALIPVAINEIILPAQVKQLTIWSDDEEMPALNLAVQIRVAKPYQLSEQGYLSRINEFPKSDLLKLLIADLTNNQNQSSQVEQQLQNQWIPLKRFLTGLHRNYHSTVADEMPVNVSADPSQLKNWQTLAQQAEKQEQWTEALSYWSRVVEGSQGEIRDRAQLSQAENLAKLSENHLAQSLWRYLSLYAQADIAELAKNQLLTVYKLQQDSSSIEKLAATMFIQRPNQNNLGSLINALVDNKHYRFALLLGLTAPDVPQELMLKAAYQVQWWKTYYRLLTQLPLSQQWFWIGLKAQKHGNYQTALDAWKKSGSDSWLSQLQQGQKIQQQFTNSQDISQLYLAWSQWQQKHPGDSIWQDASTYIKDSAGTDQYYNLERDLFSKAYRGTKQRPVKLQVMGPVNLSFKVRVLHQLADSKFDGWLQITDNREQYRYPFSNNRAVQGLVLSGNAEYLLGNSITVEHQVGQGFHEIELSSDIAPVSVSIKQQRPELPLSILAPLQTDTFLHVLNSADMTESQLNKLIPVQVSTSMAVANKGLIAQAILASPKAENAMQAEIRMTQCLAVMETDKDSRASLLFVAEQLQKRFPGNIKIRALWNRISRYSQWKTVNSIVSSAGMDFINTQGWQPANPALNIRKALISRTTSDQHVVFGNQRLLMVMTNLKIKTLNVEVILDDLAFLTNSPAQFQYQIDTQEPEQLTITRSEGVKKLVLRVPAGHHQIRFSLINPVTNQFLKLRFQDDSMDLSVSKERSFFISSRVNPLKVNIYGPATIRIDEWLKGKITSRYQDVATGWTLITIPPAKSQQQSLLQIKQRAVDDEARPVMSRVATQELEVVPPPEIPTKENQLPVTMIDDSFQPGQQTFGTWSFGTDSVRRNNIQEDSSRNSPIHYQQIRLNHRYFDEFNNRYWNTQGFVRVRLNGSPSYGLIESVRFQPDQLPFAINMEAKAITQHVTNHQEWMGQFKIAISQSARLTPKTVFLPKLSWFGRYLSLRNSSILFADDSFLDRDLHDKVDQDLYTAYKAQHTTGLRASLLFIHDPWLDTRWTARIKSVSNENMNIFLPDHISTEAHWNQLFGAVSLDASYRINYYLNDNNRLRASQRQFTKLNLNWQPWITQHKHIEIDAQYNYDIEKNAHLGMLSFTYHFGGTRGYRDFKPGEIDFRQIRERQRLDEYN